MTRIFGCDGKTIERVEHNGLVDVTTIYFTDGTYTGFNSEDDEWEIEKDE